MSVSFYDLMKYAKTGIASPEMTGFDKLRARAAFGGYPVSTITGTPPISFKSDGKPLSAWSIAGAMQQDSVPSPDSPVVPQECGDRTANIMPSSAKTTTTLNGVTCTCNGLGTYTLKGTASGFSQFVFILPEFTAPVSVGQGGNGTFSMFNTFSNSNITVVLYNGSTKVDDWKTTPEYRTHTTYSAMSGKTINKIIINIANGTAVDGRFSIMFTDDGQLPAAFQPFGYALPLTLSLSPTPIYLTEPLRKIGDYADSVSSDGTVTRRIKCIDLGGLTWTTSNNVRYSASLDDGLIVPNTKIPPAICTHLPAKTADDLVRGYDGITTALNSHSICFIHAASLEGLTTQQFQAAVTGWKLWYVLATAQTETITAPTITTAKGANTLTVDTTLQPSGVSITGNIKQA